MTRARSSLVEYGKSDLERKIAFGATAQVELCDFGAALKVVCLSFHLPNSIHKLLFIKIN